MTCEVKKEPRAVPDDSEISLGVVIESSLGRHRDG
jgi:hypothetical protein